MIGFHLQKWKPTIGNQLTAVVINYIVR